MLRLLLTLLSVTLPLTLPAGDSWPQFRGPDARGVSFDGGLPSEWSATKNVAWVLPVPGRSWSSPIVHQGAVFVTTAVNEGEDHDPKKGLYFGGNRPKPIPHVHRWKLLKVDAQSGEVVWERTAHEEKPRTGIHIKNTYASETPVTDGERVYAYFGNVGLFAYDFDGEKIWEKRWETVPTRFGWGTAASPVLHGERVYVLNDNDAQSFLVALDKRRGEEVWRVDRDEPSNWSTPFIWKTDRRFEIVTPGSGKVRSYDLDGELLWQFDGYRSQAMSGITIATPYAMDGLLYISSGYVGDKHRPLYAIRPNSSGEIGIDKAKGDKSENAEKELPGNDSIAWVQPLAAPYNPTTLGYDGQIYVLHDRGFLTSFDARTGAEVYGKQRLARSANFTTSPWAYDGKIFCLSEDGDTYVVRAGSDYELLGKNSLGEMCMATPAMADGRLYIRTISKLYCLREGATAATE